MEADKRGADRAVVIQLGDRYFYGFGQGGRVLTAWSLAGAALFGARFDDKLLTVEKKLLALGKLPRRVTVAAL